MISGIVDASLNNRLLVLIGWFFIAVVGIGSLQSLPIDAVPDVTNVQVQVLTNSPGLAPEEVERFITFPVELSMSGLPALEEVRSVSKFGLSAVTVVFEEGTDIYWARQLIAERLVAAKEEIPDGYGEPEMGPISSGLGEIYQFEVKGEGKTPMELRTILEWQITPRLRGVPGVVEVNAFGGELKSYQVTIDPNRLVSFGIPLSRVFEAIERNNRSVGGGYIEHEGEQYLVRGECLVESLPDLAHVVVGKDDEGTPITIERLGKVELAPVIRQGAVTRDGDREAVVGIVMMLMGANSRTVSRDVHAKVEEIQRTLPEGVKIDTFYDRTELVDRTIHTVGKNLLEGGALVVVVLLLLLGNIRGGLIVALAIPLSMLVAATAMRLAGLSGNLMSLGAIDFGLIVDGSVVMIENVVRYLSHHRDDPRPNAEKIRAACHEVARPVVFAVGIIAIVYLPILALRGIEGKMFKPMALTVVFALAGSLVCALTLMPVLASFGLKRVAEHEPLLFRLAKRVYEPLLDRTLRHPRLTALIAVVAFVASLCLAPFLGAEFIPRLDEGAIALQIWRIPSISLERSNQLSLDAEKVIKSFPEVKTVVSRTGRPEIATDPMGVEISDTYLILEPPETWRFPDKNALVKEIDEALKARLPGVMFSYSQPIELRVSELISGVRSDVGIKVYGDDINGMKKVADQVAAVVGRVPGVVEAKAEQTTGLPYLRVRLKREALARLGIDAQDVLDVVEVIGGKPVSTVVEGQQRFALQARFDPSTRATLQALQNLPVALPSGGMVPLGQLAALDVENGPAQISRERVSRRITIELNVRGRDLASTVAEAQAAVLRDVKLPPGWSVEWGGQFQNLQSASARLRILVPLALLLIFVLLYTTFNSMKLAALIFLNVPLAVTGGIFALALRGYPFSISAGVGFIALFGVAVLNGVVLLSYVVQRWSDGLRGQEAAHEAALARLRPVLMTALVASLGFVPMALATSAGAEVQRPLATVVIGGLLTSTLLTLLVLPSLASRMSPERLPESAVPAPAHAPAAPPEASAAPQPEPAPPITNPPADITNPPADEPSVDKEDL
jgi:heavy metal efflux system protein